LTVGDAEIDSIIAKLVPMLDIVTDGKIPKGFAAIRFKSIDVKTEIHELDLTEEDHECGDMVCSCGSRAKMLIICGRRFGHEICASDKCKEKAIKSLHVQSENYETEKYQRLLERAIRWQTK